MSEIPPAIRVIAGFWLVAAALGFAGGLFEFFQTVREGGDLMITLPLGVGVSGWTLGRGLLRGNRRAWRWSRGLAAVIPVLLAIGIVLMMLYPENAQLTFPGGSRSVGPWDPLVLVPGVGLVLFFCWQFVVLNRPATQRLYASAAPPRRDSEGP